MAASVVGATRDWTLQERWENRRLVWFGLDTDRERIACQTSPFEMERLESGCINCVWADRRQQHLIAASDVEQLILTLLALPRSASTMTRLRSVFAQCAHGAEPSYAVNPRLVAAAKESGPVTDEMLELFGLFDGLPEPKPFVGAARTCIYRWDQLLSMLQLAVDERVSIAVLKLGTGLNC